MGAAFKCSTGGTRSSDGELMRLVAGGGAAAGWKVIVGGRWRFEPGSPGGKLTGTDSRQTIQALKLSSLE